MEKVYIVIAVAISIVVLVVIYLLRERIKKGKISLSLKDKSISAEFNADTQRDSSSAVPESAGNRKGFVGNVATWWSRIRAPESARVINNKASLGSSIEITPSPKQDNRKK